MVHAKYINMKIKNTTAESRPVTGTYALLSQSVVNWIHDTSPTKFRSVKDPMVKLDQIHLCVWWTFSALLLHKPKAVFLPGISLLIKLLLCPGKKEEKKEKNEREGRK